MKVLYLDCSSGISGDMTLASLLDLGVNKNFLISELKKLKVSGYELIITKKYRHSIQMMDVDVRLTNNKHSHSSKRSEYGDDKQEQHMSRERNLLKINHIIDESDINEKAKIMSKKIFKEIAEAEAKVHGKSIEKVYFHERGAVDSIVDIVGTSICVAALDVDVVYSSPIHDGKGFIKCRCGMLPVPVPAVMAMIEGTRIPLIQENVDTEMVTPTGMGIVKCLVEDYGEMPSMKINKIGYGLGKRETGRFGAVRAIIGTLQK